MKDIPPLYHWSPTRLRTPIQKHGLKPSCPTRNGTLAVCLSPNPDLAWRLSGAVRPAEQYDLWQVHVADTPVMFRRDAKGKVIEYRIPRIIAPSGLVLLASRPC